MSGVRRFAQRVLAFIMPRRAEEELAREIASHRELLEDDLRRQGLSQHEVRAAAGRAFLRVEAAKDAQRDTRSFAWLEDARRDIRYAFRLLARDRGFTVAVVLTLALGIGVATAVFSIVNAVVLRPLDYGDPDELVQLYETGKREGGEADWVTFPNFRDWQSGSRVFEGMAAYRFQLVSMVGGKQPEGALALEVTDRLFAVLRVPPLLGRTFVRGEDRPGHARVAVISHPLWLRQFGGNPAAIGRTLAIDGAAHTIVGVMPPSFTFPAMVPGENVAPIDLWIPMRPHDLEDRGSHNFWAIGRLKPGVSLERARAEMHTIAARLARAYPATNRDFDVVVVPLREHVAGAARPALLSLLGAVGFVLLLTCANITTLLLSRAEARQREVAMRQALGASRGRLVRQMLAESVLLAFAGAAAGLGIAYAGTGVLVSLAPATIPRLEQASVDGQVLGFMAVIATAVGVLFGLAPAVLGSSVKVTHALRDGGTRATGGAAGRRVRHTLVAAQLALAVMLLVGAGLLVRSFVRVAGLDLGFRSTQVLTAMVNLSPARYPDAERQVAFTDEVLRRIQALPGVQAAGVSQSIPLTGINDQGGFAVEGRPDPPPGTQGPHANRPHVSPGYFAAMGIRLVSGRLIDERDRQDSLPVAVVSDVAARTYWSGQSPLGRRLALEWADGRPVWRQIVGVVQATRHFGPEAPQKAEVYVPVAQSPVPYMTLVLRAHGDPTGLIPAVRDQIAAIDPEQGVFGFQTMEELVEKSTARRQFQTALVTTFALLALLLAGIGVYGVMGYMVAQRRREIGVRLALGAKPGDVVAMVLGNGLRLTVAGVLAGMAGAVALSRVLAGFVYGVSPLDPATYAGAVAVLVAVSALSAYWPSRKAASMDPLVVLRDE
jgi:putative ABC transport system permease protein